MSLCVSMYLLEVVTIFDANQLVGEGLVYHIDRRVVKVGLICFFGREADHLLECTIDALFDFIKLLAL